MVRFVVTCYCPWPCYTHMKTCNSKKAVLSWKYRRPKKKNVCLPSTTDSKMPKIWVAPLFFFFFFSEAQNMETHHFWQRILNLAVESVRFRSMKFVAGWLPKTLTWLSSIRSWWAQEAHKTMQYLINHENLKV